jgi:hypothetical protein
LQRSVRRQQPIRNPREDLVWQPRFAYTSAIVILIALTVVSLPLWLVLYRISSANNGAGPRVADLVALCMMLLGGFLTGAAAWVIIIEMRGRVRMVDTLARTGEREVLVAPAAPELPVLDAPLDRMTPPVSIAQQARSVADDDEEATGVIWDGTSTAATPAGSAEAITARQVTAAATLEASSKLLSSFSSVLKSFGQLAAQVAMLAVALALFVGATVLSLH